MVMVMETPTPPQCVGHEFVRQYYTMLNEDPQQLHRFYNNNSSFIHGGIDQPGKESEPVYGQNDIHHRILELSFRDCHAKIRSVDSLITINDGVVIQVTGELSNNGEPMRRFVQTFVLAQQSPRRYYVLNDIFRYQDEIYPDDDDTDTKEGTAESEIEEDHPEISDASDVIQDHNVSPFYDQQTVSNGNARMEEIAAANVASPQTVAPVAGSPPSSSSLHQSTPTPAVVDGVMNDSEKLEPLTPAETESGTFEDKINVPPPKSPDTTASTEEQTIVHHFQSETSTTEPKTYANMVSKNAAPGSSSTTGGLGTTAPPNTPGIVTNWHSVSSSKPAPLPPTPSMVNHLPPASTSSSTIGVSGPAPNSRIDSKPQEIGSFMGENRPRMNRPRGNSTRMGMNFHNEKMYQRDRGPRNFDDSGDGDRRRLSSHPDTHQVFVGNLPFHITEDDLRELFGKFGSVLEVRINNRSTQKPGGNLNRGTVPNYGFVIFDNFESVQQVLKARPIMFQGEHRLNVEEKKAKLKGNPSVSGSGDGRPMRIGLSRYGGGMGSGRGGGRGGSSGGMNSGGRGGGNMGRGGGGGSGGGGGGNSGGGGGYVTRR